MTLIEQLASLTTEEVNPKTLDIDRADARGIVGMLYEEDLGVSAAIAAELDHIAEAVEMVADALRSGGRLIYVGAGTSGRLGILDASEMPPTYGTDPSLVQGIIAGGQAAVFRSVEGAEDSSDAGARALDEVEVGELDVVCGISASGRTPFVTGALEHALGKGAKTIFLTTNPRHVVRPYVPNVHVLICPVVGPEPIAGSTRMKSGTAQKMVLNMITTAAMVRLGKTFGNVMVDLQLTNEKLRVRASRIIMSICGLGQEQAVKLIESAGGHVKTALVMHAHSCSREEAVERLHAANGIVRNAMENI